MRSFSKSIIYGLQFASSETRISFLFPQNVKGFKSIYNLKSPRPHPCTQAQLKSQPWGKYNYQLIKIHQGYYACVTWPKWLCECPSMKEPPIQATSYGMAELTKQNRSVYAKLTTSFTAAGDKFGFCKPELWYHHTSLLHNIFLLTTNSWRFSYIYRTFFSCRNMGVC